MSSFFITGIGTGVGKTLIAAIVTEALHGVYWKPIQAGLTSDAHAHAPPDAAASDSASANNPAAFPDGSPGTDTLWVQQMTGGLQTHPETYKLALAASPHIAAREERQGAEEGQRGLRIDLDHIIAQRPATDPSRPLIIEGAGGLLVPLNESEFVLDLAKRLDAPLILVSRNYLGSINHSLLTAEVCRAHGLRVAGWIFNDQYPHNNRQLDYEGEIAAWTGIPAIASIPHTDNPDRAFVRTQAERIRPFLAPFLAPFL